MVFSSSAPKWVSSSRGCLGTRADFDEPTAETFTPGSPAYLEGQRAEALGHGRRHSVQQEREAAWSARLEGRSSNQQAPSENRILHLISTDIASHDGAPGAPGCDDSLDEPGSQIQVIMTPIGNQPTWVLSPMVGSSNRAAASANFRARRIAAHHARRP